MRFCSAMRTWFLWKEHHWSADNGAAVQLAKKTIRAMQQDRRHMLNEAQDQTGDYEHLRVRADALGKWATRSESASRIIAMLRMAESDPRLSVAPEDFDNDPWLLNLRNGSVDLHSGCFRENRPEDLATKVAGAEYAAGSQCPQWKQFLGEVFRPNPEVIPFLQRAVGYTLTAETREECIFVLSGDGRNGKGVLVNILHALLGEYGGIAEVETFLDSHGSSMREDIADMRGRRFVSAQEPMLDSRFAEGTLKWLSGGDRLRARRLYEHAQEFNPSHKLWLAVNRLPRLRADDSAAWNRMRIIPFNVSFASKPNRELKRALLSELSGILNWAVEGCLLWQRNGLGSIETVMRATDSCREAQRAHA